MIRPYETVVVYDGSLPDEVIQKDQKMIEDVIASGAKLDRVDVWGKRSLAYNINKKKTGFYCVFLYEGEASVIAALDKHFKLNESVLRHMTVIRNVKNDIARAAVAARKERPVIDRDHDDDEDMDD